MGNETYTPPRFCWLKRILRVSVSWLVLLGAVRAWWGWEAQRRFDAAVEKRRALGQPILLEDFIHEPIPDEENAAYYFGQAIQALKRPAAVEALMNVPLGQRDTDDDWRQQVSEILAYNAGVLRLIREGCNCQELDWKTPLRSPVSSTRNGCLYHLHELARLVHLSALASQQVGDDLSALDAARQALALGRAADESAAFGQLSRLSTDDATFEVLEQITPRLRVAPTAADARVDGSPATRTQVNDLIRDLLTDQFEQDWMRCLYRERLERIDDTLCLATGRAGLAWLGIPPSLAGPARACIWLIKPAWVIDCTLIADQLDQLSEPGLHDWTSIMARVPRMEESGSLACDIARYAIGYPAYERLMPAMYKGVAQRRMAATALAIRLYELDHGRRPASLENLVPEYLAVVPRDPFTAGAPIGYLPQSRPPRLYSVNRDELDEGGAYKLRASGEADPFHADFPYFLDGDRPRAAKPGTPATQPTTAPGSRGPEPTP